MKHLLFSFFFMIILFSAGYGLKKAHMRYEMLMASRELGGKYEVDGFVARFADYFNNVDYYTSLHERGNQEAVVFCNMILSELRNKNYEKIKLESLNSMESYYKDSTSKYFPDLHENIGKELIAAGRIEQVVGGSSN